MAQDKHQPETVYFDCPLCGKPLDVRTTKKAKPYVTCGDCALQMFVRGTDGMERFGKLVHRKDSAEPARIPIPQPEPKLPRGRPRKLPDVTERVERAASASPLDVLTGRTP